MIADNEPINQNVKDKFVDLLKEREVRFNKNGQVHLKDLIKKIVGSASVKNYIHNTKNKIIVDDVYYLSVDNAYFKVSKGKFDGCKLFMACLKETLNDHQSIINVDDRLFQFEGYKFECVYVFDVNQWVVWIKAADVMRFLGIKNVSGAVDTHVHIDNRMSYEHISQLFGSSLKIGSKKPDKKTTFVNISGFFNLMRGSDKKLAKRFNHWVDSTVLPRLYSHGSYSMQSNNIIIPSFYDEHAISSFYKKCVVYIGYCGFLKSTKEHIFKYGLSRNMFQREHKQHSKTFNVFEVVLILETDNAELIENLFESDMISWQLLRDRAIKKQTELFTVSAKHTIQSLVDHMKSLVANNPLPALVEADRIINESNIINDQYRSQITAHGIADKVRLLEAEYKFTPNYRAEIDFMSSDIHRAEIERDIHAKNIDIQIEMQRTLQIAIKLGIPIRSINRICFPLAASNDTIPQIESHTFPSHTNKDYGHVSDVEYCSVSLSSSDSSTDSSSSGHETSDEEVLTRKKVPVNTAFRQKKQPFIL